METEKKIQFEETTYSYKKGTDQWSISISQSDVGVASKEALAIIELVHPQLLPIEIIWEEDYLVLSFDVKGYSSFQALQKRNRIDKLRAALNISETVQLLEYPLTFMISPDNMVFDRNLLPKIAYRGWKGKMEPASFNKETFLKQYKALMITLFDEEQSFYGLYEGEMDLKTTTPFNETVQQSQTLEELVSYLNNLYEKETAEHQQTMRTVPKKQFTWFKYSSIWMSVLFALGLMGLGYLLLFRLPFQEQLLAADQEYFEGDYGQVLSQLSDIDTADLPRPQKYIAAYSVVQGASLNEDQRQVIFNTLSLNADERYLDYWVEIGRGEYTEALDAARRLEDEDLILFGLTLRIEQVRGDNALSGEEQEELLNQLQSEYDNYEESRQERLEENTEETEEEAEEEGPVEEEQPAEVEEEQPVEEEEQPESEGEDE